MNKVILLAALILCVMLAVSCKSVPNGMEPYKDADVQQKDTNEQYKDVDVQYNDLYDDNTGLDFAGAGTYTVKKGDTLSKISRRAYNDGFYYPVIMLASRGVVVNPDKIKPGMVLTIPDLEINKANDKSRKSMKNCLNGFAEIEKNKHKPNQALINGFKKHADDL